MRKCRLIARAWHHVIPACGTQQLWRVYVSEVLPSHGTLWMLRIVGRFPPAYPPHPERRRPLQISSLWLFLIWFLLPSSSLFKIDMPQFNLVMAACCSANICFCRATPAWASTDSTPFERQPPCSICHARQTRRWTSFIWSCGRDPICLELKAGDFHYITKHISITLLALPALLSSHTMWMYATFYYVTKFNLFPWRGEKKKEFFFFPCFAAVAKRSFGDRNCFQERAVPFCWGA